MAFWVYLLRCSDGRYYTGHTDDLERRMAEHQTGGKCDFTSRRRPVALVWSEYFQTRLEAKEAERTVGGWSRAKKEALIRGDWKGVSFFARPPKERFSTSLETNGEGGAEYRDLPLQPTPSVSSEVEKRSSTP
jgi:predicted GIY-YIG superfamily endonuclease